MMKNVILLLAGISMVGFVALPLVASAEGGKHGGKMKEACRADVERLCADAKGKKEIFQCLRENRGSLSDACNEGLKKARKHKGKHRKALKEACGQDFKTYCGGVEHGDGRIKACIKENRTKFSESCTEFLKKARQRHGKHQDQD